jgi:hypothetical protein
MVVAMFLRMNIIKKTFLTITDMIRHWLVIYWIWKELYSCMKGLHKYWAWYCSVWGRCNIHVIKLLELELIIIYLKCSIIARIWLICDHLVLEWLNFFYCFCLVRLHSLFYIYIETHTHILCFNHDDDFAFLIRILRIVLKHF